MNNINDKVLRFKASTCPRERNTIYKELRSIYYPRFDSKRKSYPKRYWDDLESEYDYQILMAIDRWDPDKGNLFTSFLYTVINLKVFSSVKEKIIYKNKREPSFTDAGIYDKDEDGDGGVNSFVAF